MFSKVVAFFGVLVIFNLLLVTNGHVTNRTTELAYDVFKRFGDGIKSGADKVKGAVLSGINYTKNLIIKNETIDSEQLNMTNLMNKDNVSHVPQVHPNKDWIITFIDTDNDSPLAATSHAEKNPSIIKELYSNIKQYFKTKTDSDNYDDFLKNILIK